MPADPRLHRFQPCRRLGSVSGQHVEAQLRVENLLRQRLEREKLNRLPVQLIDPLFAALTRRLEDVHDRALHGVGAGESLEEIAERSDSSWEAPRLAVVNGVEVDASLAGGFGIKIMREEPYESKSR